VTFSITTLSISGLVVKFSIDNTQYIDAMLIVSSAECINDTKHNETQPNDTRYIDRKRNGLFMTFSKTTLSMMTLSIIGLFVTLSKNDTKQK
jgi:hypothetical protein